VQSGISLVGNPTLEKIFFVLPWALYSNMNTSPSRYREYVKGFNRASVD
jgi:hypothetical protein